MSYLMKIVSQLLKTFLLQRLIKLFHLLANMR